MVCCASQVVRVPAILILLFILLTLYKPVNAQTVIWSEGFDYSDKTTTGEGSPSGITSWTADGVTNFSRGIAVFDQKLTATDSEDGLKNWKIDDGNEIDISAYNYVSISVDISAHGSMSGWDYVRLDYNVDGTGWETFETNGFLNGNFGSETATQTNISGNTLSIRGTMVCNGHWKYYYVDNIAVTGSDRPAYCIPVAQSSTGYISRVQFNTIDNYTGNNNVYTDYSPIISTDVVQNSDYNLTVTIATNYNQRHIWAWIDWNQDGIFQDNSNEAYDLGHTWYSGDFSTTITVPSTAMLGKTRMRIIVKYDTDPVPCDPSHFHGETEDYALNIIAPCNAPDVPVLSASSTSIYPGEDIVLDISGNLNDADYWAIYSESCGGALVGTTASNSYTLSNIGTTANYYVRGEGNCDGTTCSGLNITVNPQMVPDFTAEVKASTCPSSSDGAVFLNDLPYVLDFNGTSQYVDLGSSFLNNYGAFTVEAWINTNSLNRNSIIGQDNAIELGFDTNGRVELWSEALRTSVYSGSVFPADGNWHHVAGVGNGSEMRIYIDGILAGSLAHNFTYSYGTSTATTKIGGYVFDASNPDLFDGKIVKAGFWSRALSPGEISALASELHKYSKTEYGLIAGYNFFEGTGVALSGITPVGAGVLIGSPAWVDPFTYSWSKSGENFSATTRNISHVTGGNYTVDATLNAYSKTKSFVVPSEDTEDPVASCKSNIEVYLNTDGEVLITPEMIDNGSSDNCSIDSMWVSPSVLGCPETDKSTTSPVYSKEIISRDGYTVNIIISNLKIVPIQNCPDNWYNYVIQYDYDIAFFGSNIPTHLYTLEAFVGCNKYIWGSLPRYARSGTSQTPQETRYESDCATVTIDDINCNSFRVHIGGPGIDDQIVTLDEFVSGNSSSLVTLNVKDKHGNVSSCETSVTVLDTVSPAITCPSEIIQRVDQGANVATGVSLGVPIASDNCGVDTVFNNAPTSFSIGTTVVTWTVSDVSGNTNKCRQNVTIVPEEDIDVEVLDLASLCQTGQTGTTTLTWTIKHKAGTTDWTYDYTINDGTSDVASSTSISASGDETISYTLNNSALDRTYTLTLNNVKDDYGISDTKGSVKTNTVVVYAVPTTGEIIPD